MKINTEKFISYNKKLKMLDNMHKYILIFYANVKLLFSSYWPLPVMYIGTSLDWFQNFWGKINISLIQDHI